MAEKKGTQVLIGGKVYTLLGYESEEYLQRVAAYINNKLEELNGMEGYGKLPMDMKSVLLELNLADDYHKAKTRVDALEQSLEEKENELYGIKHELISLQMKMESQEEETRAMEQQIQELQLNKVRLETALEAALLGKPAQEGEAGEA